MEEAAAAEALVRAALRMRPVATELRPAADAWAAEASSGLGGPTAASQLEKHTSRRRRRRALARAFVDSLLLHTAASASSSSSPPPPSSPPPSTPVLPSPAFLPPVSFTTRLAEWLREELLLLSTAPSPAGTVQGREDGGDGGRERDKEKEEEEEDEEDEDEEAEEEEAVQEALEALFELVAVSGARSAGGAGGSVGHAHPGVGTHTYFPSRRPSPSPTPAAAAAVPPVSFRVRASAAFSDVARGVWPAAFVLLDAAAGIARVAPRAWAGAGTLSCSPAAAAGRAATSPAHPAGTLELGAGTGLAGIVIASGHLLGMTPALPSYTLTDCDEAACEEMAAGARLNGLAPILLRRSLGAVASSASTAAEETEEAVGGDARQGAGVTRLRVARLDWGAAAAAALTATKVGSGGCGETVEKSNGEGDDDDDDDGGLSLLRSHRVVIGSDLAYNPDDVRTLAAAFGIALAPELGSHVASQRRARVEKRAEDVEGTAAAAAAVSQDEWAGLYGDSLRRRPRDGCAGGDPISAMDVLAALDDATSSSPFAVGRPPPPRWGLLATTRRSPATYRLLLSSLRAQGVAYVELPTSATYVQDGDGGNPCWWEGGGGEHRPSEGEDDDREAQTGWRRRRLPHLLERGPPLMPLASRQVAGAAEVACISSSDDVKVAILLHRGTLESLGLEVAPPHR